MAPLYSIGRRTATSTTWSACWSRCRCTRREASLGPDGSSAHGSSSRTGRTLSWPGYWIVLTLSASGVLVGLAGDYAVGGGETVSGEAGEFVAGSIPDKATVYVVNEYGPPIQWYAREGFNASKVNVYYVSKFTPEFASKLQNDFDVPVYLMYPTTSTDRAPDLPYERVYETSVYRPPFVSSLGVLVDAPGKFQYYLDGRGLVVYRLDAANESVAAAGERAGVSEALGDAPQHRSRLTAHAE